MKLKENWTIDKVMKVIRKENKGYKSYDSSKGLCKYLNADGNKCLVGCFIPEGVKVKEGLDARSIIEDNGLHNYMPMSEFDMSMFQLFHDEEMSENLQGEEFYKAIEYYLKEECK